ncbi:MAG TPA: HD-GYP domain-containing protein [Ktedonobacteraceae bacterium]
MQPSIASESIAEEDNGESNLSFLNDALSWYQHIMAGHAQGTALLAQALVARLQCSEEEAHVIILAALFHDIGKIAVPATILNKPDLLEEQEWAIMRRHPEVGYSMLIEAGGTYSYIAPLVLAHHERWDGLGYPHGLAGEAIPLGARILTVVDAYNAMTEERPYRQSLTQDEAKAEIRRCAGSHYDPAVVEALLLVLEQEE